MARISPRVLLEAIGVGGSGSGGCGSVEMSSNPQGSSGGYGSSSKGDYQFRQSYGRLRAWGNQLNTFSPNFYDV